jgi:hypothetical protein
VAPEISNFAFFRGFRFFDIECLARCRFFSLLSSSESSIGSSSSNDVDASTMDGYQQTVANEASFLCG